MIPSEEVESIYNPNVPNDLLAYVDTDGDGLNDLIEFEYGTNPVDFDSDGVVSLRLTGACQGCPLSSITLSAGIERILREHVPGVERVQAVM